VISAAIAFFTTSEFVMSGFLIRRYRSAIANSPTSENPSKPRVSPFVPVASLSSTRAVGLGENLRVPLHELERLVLPPIRLVQIPEEDPSDRRREPD
jgi:hypothetical protein